ncbi:MAG: nucleoside triphosphate pyrophosphohydrolase [Bacillota bacterium]|nr:nucleoside triphosphate pyrophosphohydrolase [Bacillota bacterium]
MYEELYEEGKSGAEAVDRLCRILALLRSRDGCPWDQAQTHESLRACMIEEAYEAVDAIEKEDWEHLEEELGDVLLQVVFHAGLGQEAGRFDLAGVANRECEKMIRRHPHVFDEKQGTFSANYTESVDKVLEKWENVKRKERRGTQTASMEELPRSLPALTRSCKVQKKAADVGFDWDRVEEAFGKLEEETRELLEIYRSQDREHIKEEVGDLLFAAVNIARFLDVDPEDALNFASQKFIRRFRFIEETAAAQGKNLEEMTLTEMDRLWEQAKTEETHR